MAAIIDLSNQRFGKLYVLYRDMEATTSEAKWLCECDCGNLISVRGRSLRTGGTQSCGCLNTTKRNNVKSQTGTSSFVGMKFDKLEVISVFDKGAKGARWQCQCECGKRCIVYTRYLDNDNIYHSCGCVIDSKTVESGQVINIDNCTLAGVIRFKDSISLTNTSGVTGVSWDSSRKSWVTCIHHDGKTHALLKSKDIEKCADVRRQAEEAIARGVFVEWLDEYKETKRNSKRK